MLIVHAAHAVPGITVTMNSILASIFSPRKASTDGELCSSPLTRLKPALSPKKAKRKSLPAHRMAKFVRFVGFFFVCALRAFPRQLSLRRSPCLLFLDHRKSSPKSRQQRRPNQP